MDTPKAEKRKLTPNDVPTLREYFRTVPARTRMTSREAVSEMKDDIAEMQAKGYSLPDIAEMIERQGFDLPLSTFRHYLKQAGYQKKRTSVRKVSQPSSVPASRKASRRRDKKSAAPDQNSGTRESEPGRFELPEDRKV